MFVQRTEKKVDSMNVKRTEFTEEEKAIILAAQKDTHPPHVSKRLLALKLKAIHGMRSDEAGKIAELHATNVNRIVARFKKEGIEAIVGVRHHHEHRYMTREQEAAFLREFEDLGAAGQVIETRAIHRAYEERVGHPVTRNMIYFLLQRHQWRKVMPRSRHEKKASDEAIEAYKKNHGEGQNPEKSPAKASGDVPGRGWVWTDQ